MELQDIDVTANLDLVITRCKQ